ncbi:hypothetical protein DER45DRAFT_580376 [Fusarium avenaceum]|nr:hypothetical protein DER45DRAFT_580376 [Fusarium avenaceum]
MDPVTAVGLASAIISFVPLGVKLLQSAHEIRDSIDGSLDRNKTRKCIMDEMQAVSNRLKPTDQTRIAEQKGLYELAARCYELSQKILNLLNKISPKTPRSFENYRSAVRAWRKEDEIKDLEKQLKECRDQLLLALVNLSSQDSAIYSQQLLAIAKHDSTRIEELRLHMESIRAGVEAQQIGIEASVQLRQLLGLQEESLALIHQQRILESIRFEGIHQRDDSVYYPHESTFNWLLTDDTIMETEESFNLTQPTQRDQIQMNEMKTHSRARFFNWLGSSEGIFHISGKLGSGKSTLMKLLGTHTKTQDGLQKWAGNRLLLTSQFFFWKPGSQLQKSLTGLYRSLLYDILRAHPELTQHAFPELWEDMKSSPWQIQAKFDIPTDTAKSAIERIIFNTTRFATEMCFCFFIDGLDEYEQSHDRDYIYLVRQLNNWVQGSQGRLKLVVSSRDYNVFLNGFPVSYRLPLHDLTWFDMKRYVRDALAHLQDSNLREYFSRRIPQKANGIFLWTVLVVYEIRKKAEDEIPQDQLYQLVDSLPQELEGLFQHILSGLDTNSRQTAYQTMSILRTAQKHHLSFTLLEFSFLEDYQKDPQFSIREDFLTDVLRTKRPPATYNKRLRGICGGLVECHNPYKPGNRGRPASLDFTHRSIHEMLDRKVIKQDMDSCLGTFCSVNALSHTTFATAKLLGKKIGGILCAGITWMRLAERTDKPPFRTLLVMKSWVGDPLDEDSVLCQRKLLLDLQVFSHWGLHSLIRYGAITNRESFPILCQAAMVWHTDFVRWEFQSSSKSVDKSWKRALIANALLDTHLRDGLPIEELEYFFDGPFISSDRARFDGPPTKEKTEKADLDTLAEMGLLVLRGTNLRPFGNGKSSDGSAEDSPSITDDPRPIIYHATSHDLTIWQRYLVSCFLGWMGRNTGLPYPFHRDRFGLAVEQFLRRRVPSEFLASIDNPDYPTHVTLHLNELGEDFIVEVEISDESFQKLMLWDIREGRPSLSLHRWIQVVNPKNKDHLLRILDSSTAEN